MSLNYTLALVLLCAGESSRFTSSFPPHKRIKKQWLRIGDIPLWRKVLNDLRSLVDFSEVVVCFSSLELEYARSFLNKDERAIDGGSTRAKSLSNALNLIHSDYVFVMDVARPRIDKTVLASIVQNFWNWDCTVSYRDCPDTAVYKSTNIDRKDLYLIQTPQISKASILRDFLTQKDYTDESSLMLENHKNVRFLPGSSKMNKITTLQDLSLLLGAEGFASPSKDIFIGQGVDIHAFEDECVKSPSRGLYLGGVLIDAHREFRAHSDGDVLLHAIMDALLGSIGGGDIGEYFPDTEQIFKDADSKKLLEQILYFFTSVGYEIVNMDISILAQTPKVQPYKEAIKDCLSHLLSLPKYKINIKATTTEKMGFIGRKEGVCVLVTLGAKFIDWQNLYFDFTN